MGVCEVAWCQGIFGAFGNTCSDNNCQIYWENRWSHEVKIAAKTFFNGAPDNFANSCQGVRQNNRAEVSPQPTRQQERQMRRFKSPRQAQRFLSVHSPVNNRVYPK